MKDKKEASIHECDFSDVDDLKAVGSLVNAYILDHYGGGKALTEIQQLRLVDALNEHPKAIVLLAEMNRIRCGMIIAFENFSTFSVRPMINIHDVIVLNEYRGRGIGRMMMEALEKIAKERKCSRLTLEVRKDNIVAQSLYRSSGFGDAESPMYYWRKNI